jgi:hypothetical protein
MKALATIGHITNTTFARVRTAPLPAGADSFIFTFKMLRIIVYHTFPNLYICRLLTLAFHSLVFAHSTDRPNMLQRIATFALVALVVTTVQTVGADEEAEQQGEIYYTGSTLELAAGQNRMVRVSPGLSVGDIKDVEAELSDQKVSENI